MTPDDADSLALLVSQTWPKINLGVWSEALADLEADLAAETYVDMRAQWQDAPSVAAFRAQYRAMHTTKLAPLYPPCALCDNTGWQTGTATRKGYGEFSCAQPCVCSRGRQYEPGFESALEFNAQQRRHFA